MVFYKKCYNIKMQAEVWSQIRYFDIHSHLEAEYYGGALDEVVERMRENKVATITVGTNLELSREAVRMAEKYDIVWASIGIHPEHEMTEVWNEAEWEELVKKEKVVAIGECGLDYGREGKIEEEEKEKQWRLFEKQIDFAVKWNKPLMLHIRNAHQDVLEILRRKQKEYGEKLRGNVHFFSGKTSEAQEYVELGFSLSFTGVITFVSDYDKPLREVPLNILMAETDSPFVTPAPYRKKGEYVRNEPSYVIEVVKKMAETRGEDEEVLRQRVLENVIVFFDIRW